MSTKLTSEIIGYKVTGSFRFWCQHVLPLVYDDSLSYYELLCKVVTYLNDVISNVDALKDSTVGIIDAFNTLKEYVDSYFKNLDVQEEINNKLDEMAQSGELSDIINNCADYYSNEEAWHVIKVKEGYVISRYIVDDSVVHTVLRSSSDGTVRTPIYWQVYEKAKILPIPLEYATIAGNVESYLGVVTNAYIQNKSTFKRSIILFDSNAGPDGSTKRFGINVIVTGKHATPPNDPQYAVLPKRQNAVELAHSYYQARLNGRTFKYGANAITYSGSQVINDGYGAGMMECDTLVALVMMGIPYDLSPYASDTPSLTFNFDDLVVNPNNYSWCLPWDFNDILNRKVTYTGGENWYCWNYNLVYKDMSNLASGDMAIFRKDSGKYFDGIRHIGIVNVVDGVPWLYHVTGSSEVESPMMYEPMANVIERGGYNIDTDLYFARPNYA